MEDQSPTKWSHYLQESGPKRPQQSGRNVLKKVADKVAEKIPEQSGPKIPGQSGRNSSDKVVKFFFDKMVD